MISVLKITVLGIAVNLSLVTGAAGQARTPPTPGPTEGRLTVELEPSEITVGDRVKARLTLRWSGPRPAAQPRFPEWQKAWGRAEILHAGDVELIDDGITEGSTLQIYRQDLVLTAFETGKIALPNVTISVPFAERSVNVNLVRDVEFTVRSVLPGDGLDQVPQGAAPPRSLAGSQRFAWTATTLVGLGLALAFLLAKRLNPTLNGAPTDVYASPLDELSARLGRLDPKYSEPAHTGLSLCLRDFLGRQLSFAAAESTSREIRGFLERSKISAPLTGSLVRLLLQCDDVKFAQLMVAPLTTEGRLQTAHGLAREVESELAPLDTPDSETNGVESA